MTGRWQGSRSELGWIVTVDLRLAEEESGRFTGSGHIDIVPKGGADGTVTGLHTHPDVSLAAEAPGFLWANFDGTFEGEDLIVGSVHSPFVGTIAFALHRL
jgi:hypothetical protein